ncbi:MAG TPA: FAD-dependent oxidoreductase [Pseudobacteroides sp.]|uniref:FAD-dependent oxidoreductase n=1 Tax=Pseudobacteroides sp. TaxID=1968840 RepID=UPI002F95A235
MKKRVATILAVALTAIILLLVLCINVLQWEQVKYVDVEGYLAEDGTPDFIKDIKLRMVCDEKVKAGSIISKAYGFKKLPANISKYIGEPLYINCVTKYQSASITIKYNPLKIDGFDINRLTVLRYDDEIKKFQVLRTILNRDNNSLEFQTLHLGEFVLVENKGDLHIGEYINESTEKSDTAGKKTYSTNIVYDAVIYGGTSAGVIAACKAARLGLSVILVSKDAHLGGMSASGLSLTDVKDVDAIGGMAEEYYLRGIIYYFKKFKSFGGYDEKTRKELARINKYRTFEPHAAENIFNELLKEENVTVLYGRLDLSNGVEVHNKNIKSIRTEAGDVIRGRTFIDASYEGDLMAKAGVSYTVGREDNSTYGERYNGIQYQTAYSSQQLPPGIDPYIDKYKPELGFINGIKELYNEEGTGDKGIQAYCFRMCLTDNISNMVDYRDYNNDGIRDHIEPPPNYNKDDYELLFRYIEAEKNGRLSKSNFDKGLNTFFCLDTLPNDKIDANNCGPVSTDYIGFNYSYPEAGYGLREAIIKRHEDYQRGFLWTLQFSKDSRIPDYIKNFYKKYGLAKDEFADNDNWPYQLYIREARRMVSDYVMTEYNCFGTKVAPDSIGLASYPMDSHNVQRYVYTHNYVKYVQNEGCLFMDDLSEPRWPISYRSLVPKKNECTNLIVPVAVSASHAAYGSIRMEPTFMIMAESAATAAKIAIQDFCSVQNVSYEKLKKELIAAGQILW